MKNNTSSVKMVLPAIRKKPRPLHGFFRQTEEIYTEESQNFLKRALLKDTPLVTDLNSPKKTTSLGAIDLFSNTKYRLGIFHILRGNTQKDVKVTVFIEYKNSQVICHQPIKQKHIKIVY